MAAVGVVSGRSVLAEVGRFPSKRKSAGPHVAEEILLDLKMDPWVQDTYVTLLFSATRY